jgi:hypothetical protein
MLAPVALVGWPTANRHRTGIMRPGCRAGRRVAFPQPRPGVSQRAAGRRRCAVLAVAVIRPRRGGEPLRLLALRGSGGNWRACHVCCRAYAAQGERDGLVARWAIAGGHADGGGLPGRAGRPGSRGTRDQLAGRTSGRYRPGVDVDRSGVRACAEWVRDHLRRELAGRVYAQPGRGGQGPWPPWLLPWRGYKAPGAVSPRIVDLQVRGCGRPAGEPDRGCRGGTPACRAAQLAAAEADR